MSISIFHGKLYTNYIFIEEYDYNSECCSPAIVNLFSFVPYTYYVCYIPQTATFMSEDLF